MISKAKIVPAGAVLLFLACAPSACRKQEQAVVGVAQTAVTKAQAAASQAQASATEQDRQRQALADIPLPTKSQYIGVHDPAEWRNPFLSVDSKTINLRVSFADANPSPVGRDTMLRPEGARRQQLTIRTTDLVTALIALPASAWTYGRVVAIAESPASSRKDRVQVRRNVETAIQQLNDVGIVVEEWPSR